MQRLRYVRETSTLLVTKRSAHWSCPRTVSSFVLSAFAVHSRTVPGRGQATLLAHAWSRAGLGRELSADKPQPQTVFGHDPAANR
jgi:hypothetical protein